MAVTSWGWPGVTTVFAPQEMNNTRAGPSMSVNGGRAVDNNFTFNGANFVHFGQTTGLNYPPPDAVQEVQIEVEQFPWHGVGIPAQRPVERAQFLPAEATRICWPASKRS